MARTRLTKHAARKAARGASKYRSGLEEKVAALLPEVVYESVKLEYTLPETKHKYLTDFQIGPNSFIEVKGRLMSSERKKYLAVRDQHPEITLRFFFDKSDNKLYKGSKTTYGEWCDKNNFQWTDIKRGLPKEWIGD